jgi:predicted Fe-Mo cluster-binding NifX family protein
MKIVISSTGEGIDSEVDQRFGRCRYLGVYDTESKEYIVVDNAARSASGGAGVQSAQRVAEIGASTVLTGNVGPNAWQALKAAEVTVITGVTGKVSEAIEKFSKGAYSSADKPTVQSHFGLQ